MTGVTTEIGEVPQGRHAQTTIKQHACPIRNSTRPDYPTKTHAVYAVVDFVSISQSVTANIGTTLEDPDTTVTGMKGMQRIVAATVVQDCMRILV